MPGFGDITAMNLVSLISVVKAKTWGKDFMYLRSVLLRLTYMGICV